MPKIKHAEVLQAIIERGFTAAEREHTMTTGKWVYATPTCNPLTSPQHEWRIVPEPKPDVEMYINLYANGSAVQHPSKNSSDAFAKDDRIACLHVIINPNTNGVSVDILHS